jgi:hypothetical protein
MLNTAGPFDPAELGFFGLTFDELLIKPVAVGAGFA